MRSNLFILILLLIASSSCVRKPKACLASFSTIETKRETWLKSCSENYEFLTWDFGDNSTGVVGDSTLHTFQNEGEYTLTLTAYGRGGYKEDVIQTTIKSTYRYIDRVEISGNITYPQLEFRFGNFKNRASGTQGTYTESAPYAMDIYTANKLRIPLSKAEVSLYGVSSNIPYFMLSNTFNFERFTENPILVSDSNVLMKVFWKFPD